MVYRYTIRWFVLHDIYEIGIYAVGAKEKKKKKRKTGRNLKKEYLVVPDISRGNPGLSGNLLTELHIDQPSNPLLTSILSFFYFSQYLAPSKDIHHF